MILIDRPMKHIENRRNPQQASISVVFGQFDDPPDDVQSQPGSNGCVSGQFDDSPDDQSAKFLIYYANVNSLEMPSPCQQKDLGTAILIQNCYQKWAASPISTGVSNAPMSGTLPLRKGTINPTDIDVLCGRGGKTNKHNGNREFRFLVDSCREEYVSAPKRRKTQLSRAIVTAIRARGGRFLKLDKNMESWYDVGDTKAVEKTSQAFREGSKRKSSDGINTMNFSFESSNFRF